MIWLKRNIFGILDILKFVGILLLVFMFIHFNTAVANQAQETQAIAASTNKVVKSQGDILKAIKQVTTDGNLNSAQQTAIIICMLQVPVSNRTTDLQAQCRSQATSTPSATILNKVPLKSSTSSTAQPTPTAREAQPSSTPTKPVAKPNLIQKLINLL